MSQPPARRTSLLVLALALVIGSIGFIVLRSSDGAVKAREREARLAAASEQAPAEVGPTLEVSVLPVAKAAQPELVELTGVLEPIRQTWVSAQVAGQVVEVAAAEHAPIRAQGVLVRLDPALAEADRIRAEAAHRLARVELERQQTLGNQSVASKAELDRALSNERAAWAALLEARTRLEYTVIRAPFDGWVNALDLDPGTYVQPGTPIAQVLDFSQIEVEVLVSDRQVAALEQGAKARVRIDALGNTPFEGELARVGRASEDESGRFPVVVVLANEQGRLAPGMVARVELALGSAPSIRVPARALLHEFELDYVFVVDASDTARRVRIAAKPVPFRPDQVEVTEGLADGDRVVVSGLAPLRAGMRVRVRQD
ncbi:MAG: efflux RND transporter periplasmic adaptor subunit [Myxococcota bacterium]